MDGCRPDFYGLCWAWPKPSLMFLKSGQALMYLSPIRPVPMHMDVHGDWPDQAEARLVLSRFGFLSNCLVCFDFWFKCAIELFKPNQL